MERLKEFEKYKDMYENLSNSIEAADEYTATAISNNAKYINVNIDDEELANNVNKYLDENGKPKIVDGKEYPLISIRDIK